MRLGSNVYYFDRALSIAHGLFFTIMTKEKYITP